MLRDLKFKIYKKITNQNGKFRYYLVENKEGDKIKMFYIKNIDKIRSERDLCEFIFNNWGEGEYWIQAWARGHQGYWVFWKGKIDSEGFIFYQKKYKREELRTWQKDIIKAIDDGEREIYKEIHDELKKELKKKNKETRYGFEPFLLKSSKRGEFRFWNDNIFILDNEVEDINWKVNKVKFDTWENKNVVEVLEKW